MNIPNFAACHHCILRVRSADVSEASPWTTPGSAVGTLAHDQLTGLNDDPLVQHVTTAEITKWNGYDAQIQALAARSGISTSILLVNDSSLNGTVVDYHSISSVTFLISGASPTDTVVLNDASKISSVPSNWNGLTGL